MAPRILFLADINSTHTQKWIKGLAEDDFEIGIFSLNQRNDKSSISTSVHVFYEGSFFKRRIFSKISYLLVLPKLIYTILKFKPDIIHAHYASSYGLLGALTLFKPLFVSAWGSDVMAFPKQNKINQMVMQFVFWRATRLFVTSTILQKTVANYTSKECYVIPFGVNLNHFYRFEVNSRSHFTFGCIKHFEKIYNIDKVVLAFGLLSKKYPAAPLRLLLAGKGSEKEPLVKLVAHLGLENKVEMVGEIEHAMVPAYLNHCDVLVNISETESFGVSVAEAQACKLPVIVSNIPGFKDLVPNENFGLIANRNDIENIAGCMERYFLDGNLREAHAAAGHQSVVQQFNWRENLLQMEKFYYDLCHT